MFITDTNNSSDSDSDSDNVTSESASFALPISYVASNHLQTLDAHIVDDLELVPASTKPGSPQALYSYLLTAPTVQGIFAKQTLPLWAQTYTTDVSFIQQTQTLVQQTCGSCTPSDLESRIVALWKEIDEEKEFTQKYQYVDYQRLQFLNQNPKFLQLMSLYNLSAPVISLMLPVFFLILPFFILKLQGIRVTASGYINILKVLFRQHQLGHLFNLSNVSYDKLIYMIVSLGFYGVQIFQNIMSCRRFYCNFKKIHEELFLTKEYLMYTLKRGETLQALCQTHRLDTYAPFLKHVMTQQKILETHLKALEDLSPYGWSLHTLSQIGYTMRCYYDLYMNQELRQAVKYSFGLHGFLDHLVSLKFRLDAQQISACTFVGPTDSHNYNYNQEKQGKRKEKAKKKNKAKDKDNEKRKTSHSMTNVYYPALIDHSPVKNTVDLNQQLVITGPNAAGKTTLLKSCLVNLLFSQQFGFGCYDAPTQLQPYNKIHCYLNIPDTSGRDSLFQAEARRCKDILDSVTNKPANFRHFIVFDELYSGTNPYEAIATAKVYLSHLNAQPNVTFLLTTHYVKLCEEIAAQERVHLCHMQTQQTDDDFIYTYRLEPGISNIRGGVKVLRDLGYPLPLIKACQHELQSLYV